MKKSSLLLLVFFLGGIASAGEYSGNPDRMPSVGLNFAGNAEDGDVTVFGSSASAKQDVKAANAAFIVDLRMPISNSVTITGAIGSIASRFEAPETTLLLGQKSETSGISFSVGIRFYIH